MLIPDEVATRLKGIVDRLVNKTEMNLIERIEEIASHFPEDPRFEKMIDYVKAHRPNEFVEELFSVTSEEKELNESNLLRRNLLIVRNYDSAFQDALRAKEFVKANISVTQENLLRAAIIVRDYVNDALTTEADVNYVLIDKEVKPALMTRLEKFIDGDEYEMLSEAVNVLNFIERTDCYDPISRGVKVFKLVNYTEFDELLESDSGFKKLTSKHFEAIQIACKKECICSNTSNTHDQIDEIRQKLSAFYFGNERWRLSPVCVELYNQEIEQVIEILYPVSEHKVTYYIYVPE